MLRKEIIELLNKDLNKNVNLLYFAEENTLSEQDIVNGNVIFTGRSDHDWTYVSMFNEDIESAVDHMDGKERIMIQDEFLLDYYKENYDLEWILSCSKLIYNGSKIESEEVLYELRPEDAEYIQANNSYGEYTDVDYIRDRISKGIGLGIKVHDTLIAWVLTHDDGAIGFISVLEDYRNKGYAKKLTDEMIVKLQDKGIMPFVHIESHNIKSQNLAKKAGFEYINDVHWIKIRK